MENQNFLEPASQPGHIRKFHGTLISAVAIASIVGYFALASQLPLWPFETPLSFIASTPQPNQRACTQEAKLCPDGTAVGRTGPNCEFAKCPGEIDTSTWRTYRNDEYGFEFKYPDGLEVQQEIGYRDKIQWRVGYISKRQTDEWLVFNFGINKANNQDLETYIKNNFNLSSILKQESLYSGKLIEFEGSPGLDYLQLFPEFNNVVMFEAGQEYLKSQEFNQILSTFRFTR